MFVLSVCLSVFVWSKYTGTYVLVKSVESKVPTALAYDVARSSVQPAQVSTSSLDHGSKLRDVRGCVKALHEARNRKPETFKRNLL